MEPCITDNRSQELHPVTGELETLSSHSSPQSSMFRLSNCLATLHCTGSGIVVFYLKVEGHSLCCSRDPLSALMKKVCLFILPSRIYDFILTRFSAAHAVLCQAFSGNHSSKSFHTMRIRIPFHLSYQYLLQKPGDTEDASK